MQSDLHIQRWVLISSYRRYLDADRAWTLAQRDARSWFPARGRSTVTPIGDPGSMVRRSYETREEALQRLLLVRAKLERMRQRLAERQRGDDGEVRILLLGR